MNLNFIHGLQPITNVSADDLMVIVDDPRGYQSVKKITLAQLVSFISSQISVGGGGAGAIGAGSPEGVTAASPGTTYYNTTDGSFWVKETGVGNTGWVQLIT